MVLGWVTGEEETLLGPVIHDLGGHRCSRPHHPHRPASVEYKTSVDAGVGSTPYVVVAAVAPCDDAVALDVVAGTVHVHSTAVAVAAQPDGSQGPTPAPTLLVENH